LDPVLFFDRFVRPVWRFTLGRCWPPRWRGAPPPALVVVVALDQFRADYLEKFRSQFGPAVSGCCWSRGGFHRLPLRPLADENRPGHSVMLTGVHANLNGIIANDWIDRDSLERVSCVGDPSVEIVGLPPRPAHVCRHHGSVSRSFAEESSGHDGRR